MRISDWSSDVCSSDLEAGIEPLRRMRAVGLRRLAGDAVERTAEQAVAVAAQVDEREVARHADAGGLVDDPDVPGRAVFARRRRGDVDAVVLSDVEQQAVVARISATVGDNQIGSTTV